MKERELTDHMKLVIKSLAKHCRGQVYGDRCVERLNSLEGVESVEFSPDKHPSIRGRGVVAFVVFETAEQMNAALVDEKVCHALLDTEFQLDVKLMRCEPKDPEKNMALDRKEAGLVGAAKRQRKAEKVLRELPKPLDKATGAGGNTGLQGEWANRPTFADEQGRLMDRVGEDALREMHRQANELLVEQLGNQMQELFTTLTQK